MRGDSFVEADDGSTKPIANSACSSQYERVLSAVSRNRRKEKKTKEEKERKRQQPTGEEFTSRKSRVSP